MERAPTGPVQESQMDGTDKFHTSSYPSSESPRHFDSSPPGQNGRHFADNIFKCIFFNEKFHILIQISLKFVLKIAIDIKSALVQIMAWHGIGDKPLFEPMIAEFSDAYMGH